MADHSGSRSRKPTIPPIIDAKFEVVHDPNALPGRKQSRGDRFAAAFDRYVDGLGGLPHHDENGRPLTPEERAILAGWQRRQPVGYFLRYWSNLIFGFAVIGLLFFGLYLRDNWYAVTHGYWPWPLGFVNALIGA